jgi:WD40 repeat protein
VSTISANTQHTFSEAFSPDGSMLAVSSINQTQIFSSTNGILLDTFADHNTASQGIGVARSPDCKYIAASSRAITIYDVHTKQTVATFGDVDSKHRISTVAWAPNNNGLVSTTVLVKDDGHFQTPVNVWKLS